MVDGVVLLVDASEGPMPQTKFVLAKALNLGLRPIVLINKVDRPDERTNEVLDEVFDLFAALDANEQQLDFPTLYASGRQGWAALDQHGPKDNLDPLFQKIVDHVPEPTVDPDGPFTMLVTTLESDPYLGRVLTGKIETGVAKRNMPIISLHLSGDKIEEGRVTKLLAFRGLERVPVDEAYAGDIIAIAGLTKTTVADTICQPDVKEPIPSQRIDPPTLAMAISINDSPLAGQEGDKVTSRMIRERLMREAEGNVAIRVSDTDEANTYEVAGRGELQLGVLIETMRREGYELAVGRPRVIYKEENGQRLEPIEEVVIDVDAEYSGVVVEKLGARKGEMVEMRPTGAGKNRLRFLAPTRALIGYHNEFMTDTRGTGVLYRLFNSYAPYKGAIDQRRTGSMISMATGVSVAYGLWYLQERGPLFIGGGEKVYSGMVIGEHSRGSDLEVNPLKAKQLTNIRASGKDDAVTLIPPIRMTLEKALSYVAEDELVEVTPDSIRLRKRHLDSNERKRNSRKAAE
jgi:GTP-binding protein